MQRQSSHNGRTTFSSISLETETAANWKRSGSEGQRLKTWCQQGLSTAESSWKSTRSLVICKHNISSCVRCMGWLHICFTCLRRNMSSIRNKSIGAVAALKNWKTTSFRKCSGCWGRAPSSIRHQLGRRWPAGIGSWRCWRRRSSASPTASSAAWTSRGRWLRSGAPAPGSGTTPLKHVSIWEVQRVEVLGKEC